MFKPIRRCLLPVALLLLGTMQVFAIEPPVPPAPLTTYSYELTGQSDDALIREGCIRALKSSVGQVYFSDYMLYARDLLTAYIEKNWERLIARYKVKTKDLRGGRRHVAMDVVVDNVRLYADLVEKRFLYRPAVRPLFYIFLSETYDGSLSAPIARRRLLEMIDGRQYRYLWIEGDDSADIPTGDKREVLLPLGLPEKDPSLGEETMAEAMREAQRNEVEVFVAGTVESKTTRSGKLYFDDYTFVQTRCLLKLVRADTGEILAEFETTTAAGNVDPLVAVQAATLSAVNEVGPKTLDVFDKVWNKTILRKADMRIMATGVNADIVGLFSQIVMGIAPAAEIYTRSFYEDVAVLTLTWNGRSEDLLQILRHTDYPSFTATVVRPEAIIISSLIRPGELIIEVPENEK
ncbi:hypothetical protein JW916_09725 [Candidatus Sumerlaeota bacterium]|nr:hypothetical protein [Candidatus Sumerlaeota bacterium]